MTSTQRFVAPKLPTALADDTQVDIPGQDIFIIYLDNVHVVPARLDISKFEDALSRVLQLYPHAAGQLQSVDGRWFIGLANSGVPMDIEYKLGMSVDSFLDGNWVIQDNLPPLLNPYPFNANPVNSGAPLLRLKLTIFDHETCVGISWNHSLGDAIMMLRFTHMLSQFYQGLSPGFGLPTFKKSHFPKLSTEAKFSAPPHYRAARDFDIAAFMKSREGLDDLRWLIDTRDLEMLRSVLCSDKEHKTHLSKHDCLTAYLVAVLNNTRNITVQRVANVYSYRHVRASFIAENVAGNLTQLALADVPTDMAGIAAAIRDSLVRFREPACIRILESLKSEYMTEAANAGNPAPYVLAFDEKDLFVDSNVAIDWCSAHFGCPDGAQFYTRGVTKNMLRCFKSNPVKGEDGIWKARDAIDISMGVSAEVKPKILETLARGIQQYKHSGI